MRTPNQRLADILLGEPVEDWISRKRAEGLSWRRISLVLRDEKDIDVAPGTLLAWVEEINSQPTAAAS